MSWNFTHSGQRAAVKAAVNAEKYFPEALKATVAAIIDAPTTPEKKNGVIVSSHGHAWEGGAHVSKLEITEVTLLLDPPELILASVAAAETLDQRAARDKEETPPGGSA